MRTVIKNGTVIDPRNGINAKLDIVIEDKLIAEVIENADVSGADCVIDAVGKLVMPGLVDMHCHLREPGQTKKETIASGTRAAAAGGFTSVACMPNTDPVNDSPIITKYIIDRAKEAGYANVYPVGSITKSLKGEELSPVGQMKEAGAVAVSDDGKPVNNANLMRLAMQYASQFGIKVISHCEDMTLVNGGAMDDGSVATAMGIRGITRAAEEVMIAREIILAETYGLSVHIAHVSTKGGVQLIKEAKARGVKVTAETAPHYLFGTSELCSDFNTSAKVNPPLREEQDRLCLIEALKTGVVDCIATDHAPHTADDKNCDFDSAAFGISGIETAFPICYTVLVDGGIMPIDRLVYIMSAAPAEILGINAGSLSIGAPADIFITDCSECFEIEPESFMSKGKNTPFKGRTVKGRSFMTICGGKITYRRS